MKRFLESLFGLKIQWVPHGDEIKDYHVVQLKALSAATTYLDRFHKNNPSFKECPIPSPIMDPSAAASWGLQQFAWDLRLLMENIRSIKEYFSPDHFEIYTGNKEWPTALVRILEQEEKVTFISSKIDDRAINSYFLCLYLVFLKIPALVLRLLLPKHAKHKPIKSPSKKIAVLCSDSSKTGSLPTEPRFLMKGGIQEEDLVVYFRKSLWSRTTPSAKKGENPMTLLNQLGIRWRDGWQILKSWKNLLQLNFKSRRSVYALLRHLDGIDYFFDLSALFQSHYIGVHLFNIFPDGVGNINYGLSGAITGACRRHGVINISYQSRVYYSFDHIYFFDALDVGAFWGDAFLSLLKYTHFIRKLEVIGDVYLSTYEKQPLIEEKATQDIVFFTGDIDLDAPLHYTLDYAVCTLCIVLEGIHLVLAQNPQLRFRILLKPKHLHYAETLLKNPRVKKEILQSSVEVEVLQLEKHVVSSAIEKADFVLSTGFTTPGLEALLLGKPAAYVTPYRGPYAPDVFNEAKWVLHDSKEVADFLSGKFHFTNEELNTLDPFRDSQAAGRLAALCTRHLNP